jgi:sRNA-binding regulator protein Hfq
MELIWKQQNISDTIRNTVTFNVEIKVRKFLVEGINLQGIA